MICSCETTNGRIVPMKYSSERNQPGFEAEPLTSVLRTGPGTRLPLGLRCTTVTYGLLRAGCQVSQCSIAVSSLKVLPCQRRGLCSLAVAARYFGERKRAVSDSLKRTRTGSGRAAPLKRYRHSTTKASGDGRSAGACGIGVPMWMKPISWSSGSRPNSRRNQVS